MRRTPLLIAAASIVGLALWKELPDLKRYFNIKSV